VKIVTLKEPLAFRILFFYNSTFYTPVISMLDIKLLKKDPKTCEKKLQTKDPEISLTPVIESYDHFCTIKQDLEVKQAAMNEASKLIGEQKRANKDISEITKELTSLKEAISKGTELLREAEERYLDLLCRLPNLPLDELKISLDPKENVCVKTVGEKPHFSFPFKNHVELNEKLHLFDFQRGAKISGSGWPIYKGMGARLEWALINLMIETHLEHGFEFWLVPHLVHPHIMFGSGQLPKFDQQIYKITDKDYHLYLLPTSEVALNGLHFDEIIPTEELPKKYISYTPCFRREAGAAGSQERGLIRVHQFNKVEMFCFVKPEESEAMFHEMVTCAERILQKLELHYRNMLLVTGDTSYAAAKTIDVEAWLPGQNRYYEVSSVSNCTDFQARRSKTRFKDEEKKTQFVHTLNGSGLATSRLMVALLENNQNEDGSVNIPKALRPYLGGIDRLTPSY
jgi:seryl-tRNA synthetase